MRSLAPEIGPKWYRKRSHFEDRIPVPKLGPESGPKGDFRVVVCRILFLPLDVCFEVLNQGLLPLGFDLNPKQLSDANLPPRIRVRFRPLFLYPKRSSFCSYGDEFNANTEVRIRTTARLRTIGSKESTHKSPGLGGNLFQLKGKHKQPREDQGKHR